MDDRPLADRMRPRRLEEFVGQQTAVGAGSLIRHAIDAGRLFSMILWGPPGCGKTTLARIVAGEIDAYFVQFSAVLSGVRDIRKVIAEATEQRRLHSKRTVLFVDEIHRFNKSQQDAFLNHVESGLITLIGATTENPSFEVIAALMSRCRVVTLAPLMPAELEVIIARALTDAQRGLGSYNLTLSANAKDFMVRIADGDARAALTNLEIAAGLVVAEAKAAEKGEPRRIQRGHIEGALQQRALRYDRAGEEHFNLISALHKSLRGSDPDAALYWLARMLQAGEDPMYIARRMIRFASEDIGNADPHALTMALEARTAFHLLGHPEGDLALAQAAVYLASAPKSNRIYSAFEAVSKVVKKTGSLDVPLHIRNAPTDLMKDLGYGKGYKYAHDHDGGYTPQEYLPSALQGQRFYYPTRRGYERVIKERLDKWHHLKRTRGGTKKK